MKTKWFLIGVCLMLAGCGHLEPGLKEFEIPEDYVRAAAVEAENTVEKMAKEEHVPPSLSDDFMQRYLDMSSFDELKQRTLDGIQITNDTADMTEGEIALWEQIVKDAAFNQYTTTDLERRKQELIGILDSLAARQSMTTEEFLKNGDFGIDLKQATEFLDRQAEKYAIDFAAGKASSKLPDTGGFGNETIGGLGTGTGLSEDTAPSGENTIGSGENTVGSGTTVSGEEPKTAGGTVSALDKGTAYAPADTSTS